MWGPILNPCSRGCQEETDANGMFWSMANMDTALGIDGTGNATITGVCEGGLYINSADYTSVSQAQLPTRKCKVSTATWEPVPPGFKCGDDLVCIPDDNIGQVYIPYIRYIDNSSVSLKSFKDIAISIKNGSYTLTDATKVNDNSYFIFDTTKYTSNLSFQYYQAIRRDSDHADISLSGLFSDSSAYCIRLLTGIKPIKSYLMWILRMRCFFALDILGFLL